MSKSKPIDVVDRQSKMGGIYCVVTLRENDESRQIHAHWLSVLRRFIGSVLGEVDGLDRNKWTPTDAREPRTPSSLPSAESMEATMKKVIWFFYLLGTLLYTLFVLALLLPGIVLSIPLFLLAFSDAEMEKCFGEETDIPKKD